MLNHMKSASGGKHLTIFLVICLAAATLTAQVPQKISYQGLLKTTSCTYVTDGNYDIEFKFYDLISGGTLKHTETLSSVPVVKGLFNVILGPLPMIFNEPLFIEITVLAGPDILSPLTFSPRTELTSVAYAINALTANPVGPAGGDLTGTYPDPTIKPDAVTTGKILDATILGGDIANGQVVRSLNTITDHIKLVGKDGAAITSNLDTIFIHAGGGGGGGGISAIQNTDGRLEVTDPTGPTATVNISKTGAAAGQALMYDGSNVVWQTPGGGGGLTLPYDGSASSTGSVFRVSNTNPSGGYGISAEARGLGVMGIALASTGATYGVYGMNHSTTGYGIYGWAFNSSGTNYGVYGRSESLSGYGVFGSSPNRGLFGEATASSGINYGVYGKSNSPAGRGVYGTATATSGFNHGVYGTSNSPSGCGVEGVSPYIGTYGKANATTGVNYGVFGESYSSSGYGVYGAAKMYGIEGRALNLSGIADGVRGVSLSSSGTGVFGWAYNTSGANYGVYGTSNSTSGFGLYGFASATSGANFGVYGMSNSPSGRGVQGVSPYLGTYGRADATTGVNYGLYGKSLSSSGYGVYGIAEATSGVNYGVYGRSNSPYSSAVYGLADATFGPAFGVCGNSKSANGVGVVGQAPTTGYAGYFYGRVAVDGILLKAAGSFKIDHPLDPENKYLYHSFVESPDMMNIYNGNITLNEKGEAVVQLPDWFGALNKDFRYQLTCIGGFANIYIAEKVNKNQFKIAGGINGLEVSWQVTGIRKDAFAEKNRIPIEEDKKVEERGKYLHPQAFGLSKARGIETLHMPLDVPEMKEPEMHDARNIEPPTMPDIDKHEPPHIPPDIHDVKPPTPPDFEPKIE